MVQLLLRGHRSISTFCILFGFFVAATLLIVIHSRAGGLIENVMLAEPKLTASDGASNDYFGGTVALSGDTLVVGAENNDENGWHSGAAYIFERAQGGPDNWGQVAKLTASDGAEHDQFAQNLAISGDIVVAGALWDDDGGSESGSVYVFERDQGGPDNWGQATKLTANDAAAGDRFGSSIAVCGDTVAVGADQDNDNGSSSGSAYIFERDQGGPDNWGQVKKITAPDGAADDLFGFSMALSGDTLAIGAFWDDDQGHESGSAYIFERNRGGANNWGLVKKLIAADGAAGDCFSSALSVSGDTVAVGAPYDDDNGPVSGSVYLFMRDHGGTDNWGQVTKLTAFDGAEGDYFGLSVSISNDLLAVAAPHDDDGGYNSGSVYLYDRNQGGTDKWGQILKLTASDGAATDDLGSGAAVSDDTVAVGAWLDDDRGKDSGSVYLLDGIPGVSVNPTSGLATTESGDSTSFTVVLDTNPYADVTIDLVSDDQGEGTVAPASLVFNQSNWNIPQTVTVTGVDDATIDGDQAFGIELGAAQSSGVYDGLDPEDVALSNLDDDIAGVAVNPITGLITTESGGTATFTVALDTQPQSVVVIGLNCDDPTEGSISHQSLTFTPADWNQEQTVTATGVDDELVDGDQAYTITTSACDSLDADYNGLDPADISLSNQDDDLQRNGGGGGGGCFLSIAGAQSEKM